MQDNIIKNKIQLQGDPEDARILNDQLNTKADISEDCYYADVDVLTQEFLHRINQNLKAKFGDDAPSEVKVPIMDSSYMAYSYLFKNLQFAHVFESINEPILFKDGTREVKLRSFGIDEYKNTKRLIRDQVEIYDYKSDDDFVICLRSISPEDQIILGKVQPAGTLLETIQSVLDRMQLNRFDIITEDETLKIPILDFNIKHNYEELFGRNLLNSGWEQYYISKAMQLIRFKLNEKGAILKSEAMFDITMGVSFEEPIIRNFIFDQPFLILLKEKQAKYPYFAMWVANPDLMYVEEEHAAEN